ncbi:NAD(P)-dependent oxidoreductase [Neobacillus drentensis]|uniref:NAD-dependent epimerase/dehydratase family protein n=1 Tax=Neobacillus drentensis TaxID=220684 RepID=UPI002FFF68CB
MKKKVTIIGGSGTIGTILRKGLGGKYDVFILDKNVPEESDHFLQVDATDYQMLLKSIPKDSTSIINLLTIKTEKDLEDIDQFHKMINIHFISSFYILHAAKTLGIPKVVFASSNHTTDYYERNGISALGREITIDDYPFSRGLYGVLKLASENIGHIIAREPDCPNSVINLRIGSVHNREHINVKKDPRLHRTLLSHEDTVQLFDLALQSTVKFGTYYGVSDNPGKPWSTENAWKELGFVSEVNAMDVINNNIDE